MTTKTRTPSADNKRTHYLYYDIETIPDFDLPDSLSVDILENVKVRKTKDAEKDAEALEDKKQKILDEFSLSPLTNRVVCIAYAFDDGPPRALYGKDEGKLIATFVEKVGELWTATFHDWERAGSFVPVTFNGLAFDQHILWTKIALRGLDLPRFSLRVPRYDKNEQHVDLRRILSNDDRFARGTLSQWARRFGFEGTIPAETGGDIRALFEAEDWTAIRDKCKTDVELVRFIHSKVKRYL